MSVPDYKINYKSDFVLTINGDAGWAIPFCIKFWTGMPSQAYFVGFDGVKYINCRVGDTPTQLLVMFDDHHLPIGPLRMQIAYHTTIEEFPGSVFDEVTNARDVIVTIDGTDYQVMLDFTGEDAPELEFDLPAYANEAERIQNELQRQQNEADRIAAELQREQATAAAVQGAENVNAQLNGTTLTVTNRQGVSTSVNTKGEQGVPGPVGPEGPQGEQGPKGDKGDTGATGPQGSTGPQGPKGDTGVSITDFVKTGETETDTLYDIEFSDDTTKPVAIPKGEKGDQGEQGPEGPQGPMGDVAVITPEQQAAFTMYSETGQNTNGPMTQKAVTNALLSEPASYVVYDNADSGMAAVNVQNAITELSSSVPKILSLTWVQGGVNTADGSDNNTSGAKNIRIRSSYFPVKNGDTINVKVNGQNAAIYLYNTDKTSALGAYAVVLTNTDYQYICPQDGYVRFIVAKANTSAAITVSELAAEFEVYPNNDYVLKSQIREFVTKDEIGDEINLYAIGQGVGYPELSTMKWRTNASGSANRYHRVFKRKPSMSYLKVNADTGKTSRYAFFKSYPNGLQAGANDSTYACDFCTNHATVYSVTTASTSGWVEIPSDCNYIVLIEVNGGTNYLPKSVYVDRNDVVQYPAMNVLTNLDFMQGSLATADGSDTTATSRIKSNFIPCKTGDIIRVEYNTQHFSVREYNANRVQVANTGWYADNEYICTTDGYVRFVVSGKSASSTAAYSPTDLTLAVYIQAKEDARIGDANWRSKGGIIVGSWNIGHFSFGSSENSTITAGTYDRNLAQYKKLIDFMNADLISLPEYSAIFYNTETAREALFMDMSWGHVGTQNDYACQAVYANHKVTSTSDVNITSVSTTHYYTLIEFDLFGKPVKFIGIHFQAKSTDTEDTEIILQFNEIVNTFANDEYVIVAGDFNLLKMTSLSVFTNAGYTVANGGAWGDIETFSRQKTSPNRCLDNIASKGFYMTDVEVLPFDLSDHFPIRCKLILKQN